ncbi:homocysteine-induced endoplasmic reticulum protein isoform X3 [Colletes latitarsis]|uniref:homocysteine-induced endoplasmic reticulum protein isoform X3 n=1 Tax=Colletes latitarsis TaxID=2605962 RepID=UPI004035B189
MIMEEAVVKLIIRAPNQQIKDQIVKCDSGWTIGRLKEYLSEVYPSKPERSSQSLIYLGHLLNDSTCLKDVLRRYGRQEDQPYTVHLVCASPKTTTNKMTSEQDTEHTDHPRVTLAQIRLIIANGTQNQGDEQQQPAAQDADINGGNNGAVEDGAFNRDWLEFFYILSRIIVLFSIVYFYSSLLRFLIVIFLGFVMYLYQNGFFQGHPIPLFDNDRVDRVDNNNQVWQNEAMGPQPAPQQQNGQVAAVERPGAFGYAWILFRSFFASLIPDQPNVI